MKPYEVIAHTADLGIKAYGKTREELFLNCAYAMFSLITDLETISLVDKIIIEKTADNQNELLINWLRGLHSSYAVDNYLLRNFQMIKLNENLVVGLGEGEKFDPQRHILKKEIKAVTYHQVEIKKEGNFYTVQIIFDV
ncbi:MAG: archease [Candidatus Omnitrophica bacterium]|nr:archease [Candidatus Omnitrophota bacterium]